MDEHSLRCVTFFFAFSGCFSLALFNAPFRIWRIIRHRSLMYRMILGRRLLYGWDTTEFELY